MTTEEDLFARADYWLEHWMFHHFGDDIDFDLVNDLTAALRRVAAERDALRDVARHAVEDGYIPFSQERPVVDAALAADEA